jgi:hypothetical protein
VAAAGIGPAAATGCAGLAELTPVTFVTPLPRFLSHVSVFGITPDPFAELMPSQSDGGAAVTSARKASKTRWIPLYPSLRHAVTSGMQSDILVALSPGSHREVGAGEGCVAADYLLTWNCRHLANAQIPKRLEREARRTGRPLPNRRPARGHSCSGIDTRSAPARRHKTRTGPGRAHNVNNRSATADYVVLTKLPAPSADKVLWAVSRLAECVA